jgi:pimeloyl-ACP methyl ester carboxylesterase
MPYTNVNTIKLYYEIEGSGSRVLLLNGRGGDLRNPRHPFFNALAAQYTVLTYDHRGQGRSDNPEGPYSAEILAEDTAALMDELGWGKSAVIGPSMGGFVAQYLTARHPDQVAKLVLVVTYPGGKDGKRFPADQLEGLPLPEYIARNMQMMDTRWDRAWQTSNPGTVDLFSTMIATQRKAREADPTLDRSYWNQLNIASNLDTTAVLPSIRVPTYIISGRYDGLLPADNAPLMASLIPGSRYDIVDHGHISWVFDPAVAEKIIAFLLT